MRRKARGGGYPFGPSAYPGYFGSGAGQGANYPFPQYANGPLAAVAFIRRIAESSTLAQSYIRQMKTNVVGQKGPSPTFSNVASDVDKKKLKRFWAEWSRYPVDDGRTSWPAVLRSLVGSWARDGRALALLRTHNDYPFGFAIRPLSRDWLVQWHSSTGQPVKDRKGKAYDLVGGRLLEKSGRVAAYSLWGDAQNNNSLVNNNTGWTFGPRTVLTRSGGPVVVPADKVADFYAPAEADDVVGFPSLMLPIIWMILHIARLDESMVVTMEQTSDKMGFIEREQGANSYVPPSEQEGDYEPPDTFERNVIELLPEGYKFRDFLPGAPNPNIAEYRKAIIKNIAAGAGIDYAGLSGDLREVNFSSIRQGVQNARDNYRVHQNDLETTLCKPILRKLITIGRMRGELDISNKSAASAMTSSWQHRTWGYIDPLKDAKTSEVLMALGANSLQDVCAAHGLDWKDVLAEIKEVKDEVEKLGIEGYINQPGTDVEDGPESDRDVQRE